MKNNPEFECRSSLPYFNYFNQTWFQIHQGRHSFFLFTPLVSQVDIVKKIQYVFQDSSQEVVKKKKQRLLIFDQFYKPVQIYLHFPLPERMRILVSILKAAVDFKNDKRIMIPLTRENLFIDADFKQVKFLSIGKYISNVESDMGERDFQTQARNLMDYLLEVHEEEHDIELSKEAYRNTFALVQEFKLLKVPFDSKHFPSFEQKAQSYIQLVQKLQTLGVVEEEESMKQVILLRILYGFLVLGNVVLLGLAHYLIFSKKDK